MRARTLLLFVPAVLSPGLPSLARAQTNCDADDWYTFQSDTGDRHLYTVPMLQDAQVYNPTQGQWHDMSTFRTTSSICYNGTSDSTRDNDYYALSMGFAGNTPNGCRYLHVQIEFTHAQGDLDLQVIRSDGLEISASQGVGNSEHVAVSLHGGDDYPNGLAPLRSFAPVWGAGTIETTNGFGWRWGGGTAASLENGFHFGPWSPTDTEIGNPNVSNWGGPNWGGSTGVDNPSWVYRGASWGSSSGYYSATGAVSRGWLWGGAVNFPTNWTWSGSLKKTYRAGFIAKVYGYNGATGPYTISSWCSGS
jgi:hypothetical protein